MSLDDLLELYADEDSRVDGLADRFTLCRLDADGGPIFLVDQLRQLMADERQVAGRESTVKALRDLVAAHLRIYPRADVIPIANIVQTADILEQRSG